MSASGKELFDVSNGAAIRERAVLPADALLIRTMASC